MTQNGDLLGSRIGGRRAKDGGLIRLKLFRVLLQRHTIPIHFQDYKVSFGESVDPWLVQNRQLVNTLVRFFYARTRIVAPCFAKIVCVVRSSRTVFRFLGTIFRN